MKRATLVFVLLASGSAIAQPLAQAPYERILVPIAIQAPIPGAHGSVWVMQLAARNNAEIAVEVTAQPASLCTQCPILVAPHRTFVPSFLVANPNAGQFLYVGQAGAGKVTFSLRVQDISRQSQTWGTSIPVVAESEARTDTIHLLDVPVDSQFRSALRVYDFDTPADGSPRLARVRVFDMCGIGPLDGNCSDTPLAETVIDLVPSGIESSAAFPDHPGAAMIGDLVAEFPQLLLVPPTVLGGGATRPATVRIDIDPVTPNLRFWAFVSATNNDTQHVTAIVPE